MRRFERILAMSVAAALAVGPVSAAPPLALLKASITSASGLPLPGLELGLVSLDTGRRVSGATNASGVFATELPPGLYSLDTIGSGYTLLRGPRVVSLAPGQVLATTMALATPQEPTDPPPAGGAEGDKKDNKTAMIVAGAIVVGGTIAILVTSGDDGAPPASPSR